MPTFKLVPSKIDFPALEREVLAWWQAQGIVGKYVRRNERSRQRWSFLDGPITANNPMGVHHAWGRTYKDAYQRYHAMLGCQQRYQNGFDCQGLWVEVEVEKQLGLKSKRDIENLVPGDVFASIDRFVRFPLRGEDLQNENLLVWTTTPWTLTSNVAAAVNPDLTYLKVLHRDQVYYVARAAFTAHRLEDEFKRKEWVPGVPKLKTL